MSLPELRCLLCDLVLLDETTALPAERCQQCGKLVQLGLPPVAPTVPSPESIPAVVPLTTAFDDIPEEVPVVRPRSVPPVLRAAAPEEIPVVQPRVAAPAVPPPPLTVIRPPTITRPNWEPPRQSHPPVPPNEDQIERPKPRFGCAILVVIACMLLAIMAITFIIFAIARGLRKLPKTEATPTKVVSEATPPKSTPDKPKPGEPEVAPAAANTLWVPPRGTFPLAKANAIETADAPLPGVCSHGVLAGGGRFILFPTPSAQMIAVFDTATAGIVGYIPMPDVDSLVAGSANRVFVLSPSSASITVFDLSTLKRERTELGGALFGDPKAFSAGHASGGPLFLLADEKDQPGTVKLHMLNPDTLQPIEWKPEIAPFAKVKGVFTGNLKVDRAYLRASSNGRVVIGGIASGKQNYRVDKLELLGPSPVIGPESISISRPAFPTADGGMTAFENDPKTTRYPMAEGNGYFELVEKAGSRVLVMTFNGEPHVQRGEVTGITDFGDDDGPNQDRRAFFVPSAQAFVYLGADGKTIHWRHVKLSGQLAQDYLLITSAPPTTATRGKPFKYTPNFLTNSGEVSLKLEVAPADMKVEGKSIVWDVPDTIPTGDVRIELTAESRLKPSVTAKQRFTLLLTSAPPNSLGGLFPPKLIEPVTRTVPAGEPDDRFKFSVVSGKPAKRGKILRTSSSLTTPVETTVTILAGPAGIKWVGDDIVWNVPNDAPLEPIPIVVSATTKTGQRVVLGYLLEIQE